MPLRMLAPASIVIFAVVLLILVISSGGAGDSPSIRTGPADRGNKQTRSRTGPSQTGTRPTPRFYSVKPGDTLGGIAASTGVDIGQLVALNPSIDPRALVTGQRIKLHE